MKPYARQCGGDAPKLSTNDHYGRHTHLPDPLAVDKTERSESRPGAKEKIRNAKRSFKKRARQRLKKEMEDMKEQICSELYYDYPKVPIGGGNPYYCCASCGRSNPDINGKLSGHNEDCAWVKSMRIISDVKSNK